MSIIDIEALYNIQVIEQYKWNVELRINTNLQRSNNSGIEKIRLSSFFAPSTKLNITALHYGIVLFRFHGGSVPNMCWFFGMFKYSSDIQKFEPLRQFNFPFFRIDINLHENTRRCILKSLSYEMGGVTSNSYLHPNK